MIPSHALIEKAKTSRFYLKMLNYALTRVIPFNRPHGFKITEIDDDQITVKLPYKNSNLNHIKGLHACALATLSEFSTGLLLLNRLDPQQFRIIMKSIHMTYHFQGKSDAVARFSLSEEWIETNIIIPLKTNEAVIINCEIKIYDQENHHLSTGQVEWQIKHWSKVKTSV